MKPTKLTNQKGPNLEKMVSVNGVDGVVVSGVVSHDTCGSSPFCFSSSFCFFSFFVARRKHAAMVPPSADDLRPTVQMFLYCNKINEIRVVSHVLRSLDLCWPSTSDAWLTNGKPENQFHFGYYIRVSFPLRHRFNRQRCQHSSNIISVRSFVDFVNWP